MFCSRCGKRIPEESRFCPACGAAVLEDETDQAPETKGAGVVTIDAQGSGGKKKKNGKIAVVAAVVAVIALVLVGVFGGQSDRPSSDDSANQAIPAEPTTLEEWAQINEPELAEEFRNDFLRGSTLVKDVSVQIVGNQITVRCYLDVDSDSLGYLGKYIAGALNEEWHKEERYETRKACTKWIYQFEEATGIEPVKMHLEECYSDGSVIRTYDFTSTL